MWYRLQYCDTLGELKLVNYLYVQVDNRWYNYYLYTVPQLNNKLLHVVKSDLPVVMVVIVNVINSTFGRHL